MDLFYRRIRYKGVHGQYSSQISVVNNGEVKTKWDVIKYVLESSTAFSYSVEIDSDWSKPVLLLSLLLLLDRNLVTSEHSLRVRNFVQFSHEVGFSYTCDSDKTSDVFPETCHGQLNAPELIRYRS